MGKLTHQLKAKLEKKMDQQQQTKDWKTKIEKHDQQMEKQVADLSELLKNQAAQLTSIHSKLQKRTRTKSAASKAATQGNSTSSAEEELTLQEADEAAVTATTDEPPSGGPPTNLVETLALQEAKQKAVTAAATAAKQAQKQNDQLRGLQAKSKTKGAFSWSSQQDYWNREKAGEEATASVNKHISQAL